MMSKPAANGSCTWKLRSEPSGSAPLTGKLNSSLHRAGQIAVASFVAGSLWFSSARSWSQAPDPQQAFNEAVRAQQSGDSAKALEGYNRLLRAFPENLAVRVNLGGLLVELGRLDEAIADYRLALKASPDNRDLRFGLDAALLAKNDPASLRIAEADLERFHAENLDELTATMLLAEVYNHQQHYSQATQLLQPLEGSSEQNDDFEFLLGTAMLRDGQLAQGVSRMDRVASRNGSANAYLEAGEARLTMSQFDLAQKDAEAALSKQPDLPGAQTLYGCVLEHMGKYDEAAQALRNALTQDPDDFDANFALGSLLYFNRDLEGASTLLEHALHMKPNASDARYKLALVQQSRGETPAALKNLEIVTHERPDWLEPHAKLSTLYFQSRRPVDGAREARSVEALVAKKQTADTGTPSP